MNFLRINFSLLLLILLLRPTLQESKAFDPNCIKKISSLVPQVVKCCKAHEGDELDGSKCFGNVPINNSHEKGPEGIPCQMQCLLKEKGYTDESGEIDLDALDASLNKTFNGDKYPEYVETIQKAYRTCYQTIKHEAPSYYKSVKGECPLFSLMLWTCASQEVFLHCPKSNWKSSKTCDKAKHQVKQCSYLKFIHAVKES